MILYIDKEDGEPSSLLSMALEVEATDLGHRLVLVRDQQVLDSLQAMPAKRWFEARDGLMRTFPEGLTVLSVEITPGQTIQFARERFKGKAWAALAFANYATPGEHRQTLPLAQDACVLRLDAQDFAVAGPPR